MLLFINREAHPSAPLYFFPTVFIHYWPRYYSPSWECWYTTTAFCGELSSCVLCLWWIKSIFPPSVCGTWKVGMLSLFVFTSPLLNKTCKQQARAYVLLTILMGGAGDIQTGSWGHRLADYSTHSDLDLPLLSLNISKILAISHTVLWPFTPMLLTKSHSHNTTAAYHRDRQKHLDIYLYITERPLSPMADRQLWVNIWIPSIELFR